MLPSLLSRTRPAFQCPKPSFTLHLARAFSASPLSTFPTAVPLSFVDIPAPAPEKQAQSKPLVILHGLFGSKQNWKALSKAMATRLNTRVVAVDLRNHGESAHSEVHDYTSMAQDVATFIDQQSIERPVVLGHSMGGKVAMTLALTHRPIDRFIIADMSPVKVKLSEDFSTYVSVMREIQEAKVKKQSEADAIMQKVVPELGVRQFLLTNLKREPGSDHYAFRIPLETLQKSMPNMGDFDFEAGRDHYDGKILFIKGDQSGYIRGRGERAIKDFFPNARVASLDAGHWLHAEKPDEFVKLVVDFAKEP